MIYQGQTFTKFIFFVKSIWKLELFFLNCLFWFDLQCSSNYFSKLFVLVCFTVLQRLKFPPEARLLYPQISVLLFLKEPMLVLVISSLLFEITRFLLGHGPYDFNYFGENKFFRVRKASYTSVSPHWLCYLMICYILGCFFHLVIAPRSGLAWKYSIDVGAGVIDADYRGPVGVVLFNHSEVDFEVKAGDRIAQLIVQKIVTPEVEQVDDLDSTVRGSGGFGSTGV